MNGLLASAWTAGKVARDKKDEIKLLHCTGDFVVGLADATFAASQSYIAARTLLSQHRAALVALRDEAREFTMLSCDILKPVFGRSYSGGWDETGFKGSLASPMKPELLMILADNLARFFAAHPELEFSTREVTAASAAALSERLKNAIFAVNSQDTRTQQLKAERDRKLAALRKCMRSMVDELNILLEPLDPRWKTFGFNMPGAKQTPDAPEKIEVKIIDNQRAEISWPAPARAEYYRVWMKVKDIDAEPMVIGSPTDTDFMLEELPPKSTVEIFLSAVNSGGESELSAPVTIVTQ